MPISHMKEQQEKIHSYLKKQSKKDDSKKQAVLPRTLDMNLKMGAQEIPMTSESMLDQGNTPMNIKHNYPADSVKRSPNIKKVDFNQLKPQVQEQI